MGEARVLAQIRPRLRNNETYLRYLHRTLKLGFNNIVNGDILHSHFGAAAAILPTAM